MYDIALKMMIGDKMKYLMLISAIAFSTLLMAQQTSVFLGLLRWTTANILNSQAPIWVMDPNVEQVNESKPMRDTDVSRVRSVSGVEWAMPFYVGLQQARLNNGRFKTVQIFGVDPTTLIGTPPKMIAGRWENLRENDAVIIDQAGLKLLSDKAGQKLGMDDTFEINDHNARIVGICDAYRSFYGYPYVYTTYERALQIVPPTRKNLSFILVNPKSGLSVKEVAEQINKETGLKARLEDDFFWETIWWFFANTTIPISFGTIILLGLIVGVAVTGQTFYSFILENLGNLGALKAMGATSGLLQRMLFLQAFSAGAIGYGIGIGIASIFGTMAIRRGAFPFYMPYQVPLGIFIVVILICSFASYLGIRKINTLEPSEVFRA